MIYLILFSIAFIVLYFSGNKSVHNEIIIYEDPEKVWEVLTETDIYKEWNPVMELLEGNLIEGNKVKYRFTQDEENIIDISTRVKKIIPNKLLNQVGGIPFVIKFDHTYVLEKKEQGTKLTIHEDYNGVYVNFWNPKPVELAYKRLNESIKKRLENNIKKEKEKLDEKSNNRYRSK